MNCVRKKYRVGIMDSGLGGLSVLHCAKKMIPNVEFIYYADEEHVPYGEKSPDEIQTYVKDIINFLIQKQVDAIVIACNTATTIADQAFREQFPVPIIGMEPAVKKAMDEYGNENKRVLVAATPITIGGDKLKNLVAKVDKDGESDLIALPKLVRFAESGIFHSKEVVEYLRNELKDYDLTSYGTVVLGCTHFNYFKESFREVCANDIHFVDGNEGTIHQLIRVLGITPEKNIESLVEYYFSGNAVTRDEKTYIDQCMKQLDHVFSIN